MKFTLRGIYVATATPFTREDRVDEAAVERLVAHYAEAGVAGVVPIGTTGESVTLTEEERARVVELTRKLAPAAMPVIAGAGNNDTRATVESARRLEKAGADGLLVICPYYNRPTQEGLYRHFRAAAEATALPVILYNIPIRTGRNIETETVLRLAEIPNVVGVKEASGNLVQAMEIIARAPREFAVLSGEDPLTFSILGLGGRGAISAAAGVGAADWVALARHVLEDGDLAEARRLHYKLMPIVAALFQETNPAPVKTALQLLGLTATDDVRLPLVRTSEPLRKRLDGLLREAGYLK